MTDQQRGRSGGGSSLLAPKRLAIVAVAVGVGLAAILLYAYQAQDDEQIEATSIVGSAIMFSLAALLSGGLVGFLFGIPRALSADRTLAVGSTPAAAVGRYAANTNLEQISDWLTKLLLGATLVQLGAVREGAASLFDAMAPSLGDQDDSAAFAGALVIYFAVVGFLFAWLATRLFLTPALNAADQAVLDKLAEASAAEQAGDMETASQLRREAESIISDAARVAERYDELRESRQPGWERTAEMEETVANARRVAQAAPLQPDVARAMFAGGTDGQRIFALGLMQGRPELADLEAVLDGIAHSRSAFEQYHALQVAQAIANDTESLDVGDRASLAATIREALTGDRRHLLDSERRTLAQQVLTILEPAEGGG